MNENPCFEIKIAFNGIPNCKECISYAICRTSVISMCEILIKNNFLVNDELITLEYSLISPLKKLAERCPEFNDFFLTRSFDRLLFSTRFITKLEQDTATTYYKTKREEYRRLYKELFDYDYAGYKI